MAELPVRGYSIAKLATGGVLWSVVQSWGGRLIAFVVFVVLARFLKPSDFGIAAAAVLCLSLIGIVADFGFGNAIIQRPKLSPADVNLPFFLSVAAAALLAGAVVSGSGLVEDLLNVKGLRPVLTVVCAIAPVAAVSLYQEANYRRRCAFRELAIRMLLANSVAGFVAIAGALMGWGVWSLVAFSCVTVVVGCAWLWRRPLWSPSLVIRFAAFRDLGRFGTSITIIRLLEFTATRFVEITIARRYGLSVLGLYAVGSRVYLTLMQLLQSVLTDVALTVLSKVAHDREYLARIYLQGMVVGAYLASPIFVMGAALAPEICDVLFGPKWSGVADIARPLLLLGAVLCVQFLNGAYLSARGKPHLVMVAAFIKVSSITVGLLLLPTGNVADLIGLFAALQLVATPFMFRFATTELGIPIREVLVDVAPALCANLTAYCVVWLARPLAAAHGLGQISSDIALAAAFACCYGAVAALLGSRQLVTTARFVRNRFKGG